MIKVREAVLEDARTAAHIRYEASRTAFSEYVCADTLEACTAVVEYERIFTDSLRSGSLEFLIGMCSGNPAGMLSWRIGEEMGGSGEVVSLHTLPESWGSGLGAAMLDAAVKRMRTIGLKRVYLWTFQKNSRARRFYEKFGFTPDGAQQISRYDGAVELRYTMLLEK